MTDRGKEPQITMPYELFVTDQAINMAKVEKTVVYSLRTGPSTVKSLAGLVKGTDDPRIGVVVTFQSWLQLESDGWVVLCQLGDDVSVSQP